LKEEYEKKELDGCTFKPITNTNTKKHGKGNNTTIETTTLSGGKRIEELYKIGIDIVSKKLKGDKPYNEIEEEKNKKDLTFKPLIEK
jgi:hypothetical protein